jgi:CRISPR-associated endoribonuclease Cas6
MPSRWDIPLVAPGHAPLPLTAPHAVVSGWLDDREQPGAEAEAAPGRSGHAEQARRWACGPVQAGPLSADGSQLLVLTVRLLDDGLSGRLHEATRPGTMVRLGSGYYEIRGHAERTAQVSWTDLARWDGSRAWQVRFVTPACARQRNRTSPLLAPGSLARSLAGRWRRLAPETAPVLPAERDQTVWISDLDGRSETVNLVRLRRGEGRPRPCGEIVSGFAGRIRYVCDQGTDAEAGGFAALLALASFAGAGSHTAYGFGVVTPEPTWQPPTVRATVT